MIDPAYCLTMARYGRWQNRQLYAACAGLTDEQRKQPDGSFFGSIHGTLNHLIYGDTAWLGRFEGIAEPIPPDHEFHSDFAALNAAREALDDRLVAWAMRVEPSWLAANFRYVSFVTGQSREAPAWLLAVHMFNHQTHHRGQLTDQLARLGADYGVTDLPAMPAEP